MVPKRIPARFYRTPDGRHLWEVRSSLPQSRIARVIFCVVDGQMILLNGFIKKAQKTPPQEIDLALKRMKGSER
jgi:phage-related protein